MSSRSYELGVFGATGYTGQHIVRYLARLHSTGVYTKPILLAGRSESRLQSVLSSLPPSSTPYLFHVLGGVSSESSASLASFTQQVSVVISAAGPFRLYGAPLVAACIASSRQYVDVTGEPEFIERMVLQHDGEARSRGLRIVHACGFDSIPADMGVLQCVAEARRKYGENAVVRQVDAVVRVHTGPHGAGFAKGTWASIVHSLANRASLASVRRQLKVKYAADGPSTIHRVGPPPAARITHYHPTLHKHCLILPGGDAAVVRNTQTQLTTRGYDGVLPYFGVSFTVRHRWQAWLLMAWGALLYVMTLSKWMQAALLRWPRLFSGGMFVQDGPTQQQLDTTSLTFDFFASGYRNLPSSSNTSAPSPTTTTTTTTAPLPAPDLRLHVRLRMKEPGYVATPIFAVQAALTLLEADKAKRKLPVGVMTPGTAFKDSDLLQRLEKEGMRYEVVEAA